MAFSILIPKEIADKLKAVGVFEEFTKNLNRENFEERLKYYLTKHEIDVFLTINYILEGYVDVDKLRTFLKIDNEQLDEKTTYVSDTVSITSYLSGETSIYVFDNNLSQYELKDLLTALFYKLYKYDKRAAITTLVSLYDLS